MRKENWATATIPELAERKSASVRECDAFSFLQIVLQLWSSDRAQIRIQKTVFGETLRLLGVGGAAGYEKCSDAAIGRSTGSPYRGVPTATVA